MCGLSQRKQVIPESETVVSEISALSDIAQRRAKRESSVNVLTSEDSCDWRRALGPSRTVSVDISGNKQEIICYMASNRMERNHIRLIEAAIINRHCAGSSACRALLCSIAQTDPFGQRVM